MNRRQELFVAEYLLSRNATDAARKAGYSERRAKQTGSELLRKPHIAAAIDKADADRREKLAISEDDLVAKLLAVHDGAVKDRKWSAATKPIELLMRHLGIGGSEKQELVHSGEVVYTLKLDRELPSLDDDSDEIEA